MVVEVVFGRECLVARLTFEGSVPGGLQDPLVLVPADDPDQLAVGRLQGDGLSLNNLLDDRFTH